LFLYIFKSIISTAEVYALSGETEFKGGSGSSICVITAYFEPLCEGIEVNISLMSSFGTGYIVAIGVISNHYTVLSHN
jgi:hypothetical protein